MHAALNRRTNLPAYNAEIIESGVSWTYCFVAAVAIGQGAQFRRFSGRALGGLSRMGTLATALTIAYFHTLKPVRLAYHNHP
jgi:hypothetical protein